MWRKGQGGKKKALLESRYIESATPTSSTSVRCFSTPTALGGPVQDPISPLPILCVPGCLEVLCVLGKCQMGRGGGLSVLLGSPWERMPEEWSPHGSRGRAVRVPGAGAGNIPLNESWANHKCQWLSFQAVLGPCIHSLHGGPSSDPPA